MTIRKILILNGHSAETSLSSALTKAYAEAAQGAGHKIRQQAIFNMQFDMDFGAGSYKVAKPLEPDLEKFLKDLEWADHLVMSTPMWWGSLPAKLKGLFDRALIPGRTFDTRQANALGLPKPLLTGKTARVLLTSDTPPFLLWLFYGNAIKKTLRRQILGFVGITPTRFTTFAPATDSDQRRVKTWTERAAQLGAKAA